MRRSLALSGLSLVTAALFAATPQSQHGAHEHGTGELEVAVDGRSLSIHLILQAMNVVGFEHQPQTPAQRRQLAAVLAQLRDGEALFQPNPEAACRLIDRAVSTALGTAGGQERQDHGHDESRHDDHADAHQGHDHHAGDAHAHEASVGAPGVPAAHADFEAGYLFDCAATGRLDRLGTTLFEALPGTGRLRAVYATPAGQGTAELQPDQPLLRLR